MANGFGTLKFSLVCMSRIPSIISTDLTRFIKRLIVFLNGRYRKAYVAHVQCTFTKTVEGSGAYTNAATKKKLL